MDGELGLQLYGAGWDLVISSKIPRPQDFVPQRLERNRIGRKLEMQMQVNHW